MINYEVNLEINANIYDDFVLWLKSHMQEMLQFNGFQKANLYEEINLENHSKTRKLIVNYNLDTLTNLQEYLDLHATIMRNKAIKKFGSQIKTSRRILKLNHTAKKE